MKHTEMTREQVSALMDGQLRGDEFAQAMGEIDGADELRATWSSYHLIGDVLRSGAHSPCTDGAAFMSKLQRRLAQEPIIAVQPLVAVQPVAPVVVSRIEAANEPMFRWKLVAGAASLAAAAAIGWGWVGNGGAPAGAQLAQQQQQGAAVLAVAETPRPVAAPSLEPNQVLIGNRPQVMLRDPRLDQLLEAHQQAGGASQMPSGFLRNATFEGPSR